MKNFFFLLALAFFSLTAHSVFAADWSVLSLGDAQSFRTIIQSGNNLVAAGSGGRIFYSSNNGENWVKSFEAPNINYVDFATTSNGDLIAIGSLGNNQISSDSGLTWSLYSFGISQDVYEVDMKSVSGTNSGFLVGAKGIYRTFINGTWNTPSLGITTDLKGAEDRGNGTGWIVGADGKILKLILSGLSWAEMTSGTRETLNAVRFVSDTKGFIVGTMGTVLKTVDGGTTWVPVSIEGLSSQALYSMDVLGDRIVITGDKVLISSSDAGETWAVKTFEGTNKKFYGALIKDATHIYAVGSDDDSVSLIYQLVEEPVVVKPPVVVVPPEVVAPVVATDSLVKLKCSAMAEVNDPCKAVYFYSTDGKRHAFPNDKVYFSWFADFASVKEVDATFLASLPLGKNVTYHSGVKMVKFQTSPTVYTVSQKGTLHAVATEEVAASLYGSDWNTKIDDISDVFYKNYIIGEPVNMASDYDVASNKAWSGTLSENF